MLSLDTLPAALIWAKTSSKVSGSSPDLVEAEAEVVLEVVPSVDSASSSVSSLPSQSTFRRKSQPSVKELKYNP